MAQGLFAGDVTPCEIAMSTTSPQTTPINVENAKKAHYNLSIAELVESAIQRGEGTLTDKGALVASTGKYTGRTPEDKFVVREPSSEDNIWWDNNKPMDPEVFDRLLAKANQAISESEVFITDAYGGTDPAHQIKVRVITQKAWHATFIRQLLVRPKVSEFASFVPEWTIVDLCEVKCDPEKDGTRSEAVIALNFAKKTILIMGTQYAGEMKKSVFTVMNYLLPLKGVLSMHCSANVGEAGDAALFFGLSGTGKTTLSADPDRDLVGDDEHGWDEKGIFNIEGGCYAKCIDLTEDNEPQIYNAIRFGAVLENVVLDDLRRPKYEDSSRTENTRCAYPVEHISNARIPGVAGIPKNIVFLTADAFGVLPPISKLTPEQAMYHFLNGYTAKVAGTELGVTEPKPIFSTCFGAPFLPLRPKVYADLLMQKAKEAGVDIWLVNTGWTGGPYGVGHRMKLSHTRAMLKSALSGALSHERFETESVFGLAVPVKCPGVPAEVLMPRQTWSDPSAYDAKAKELHAMFEENFKKFS